MRLYRTSRHQEAFLPERGFNMNINTSLFYAALAACLGTGYGARYIQSDMAPARIEVARYAECEDPGKPQLDKTQRPLARGGGF